jgi:hypothetical protein
MKPDTRKVCTLTDPVPNLIDRFGSGSLARTYNDVGITLVAREFSQKRHGWGVHIDYLCAGLTVRKAEALMIEIQRVPSAGLKFRCGGSR